MIWANRILKDYLTDYCVVNQQIDKPERKVLEHDQKFAADLVKSAFPK